MQIRKAAETQATISNRITANSTQFVHREPVALTIIDILFGLLVKGIPGALTVTPQLSRIKHDRANDGGERDRTSESLVHAGYFLLKPVHARVCVCVCASKCVGMYRQELPLCLWVCVHYLFVQNLAVSCGTSSGKIPIGNR